MANPDEPLYMAELAAWHVLLDTARVLPGVPGHEPKALSLAAANALGAPDTAGCGPGNKDGHRDRLRLRVLGTRPLFGCLPIAVW